MRVFAKGVLLCAVLFSASSAFGQIPAETGTAEAETPQSESRQTAPQSSDAAQDESGTSDANAASGADAGQTGGAGNSSGTDAAASAAGDSSGTDAAASAAGDSSGTPAAETGGSSPTVVTAARLEKQIREVGTGVDTLKEDTFTTKSRLLLLREEVLQRSVSGSRIQVRHKNEMGGQYTLVQVYYAIDQQPIFMRDNSSGDLDDIDDEVVSDRLLSPGSHQLTVLYIYKGKPWGVFSYMNDYTFRVESGYDFSIAEGKSAELVITAAEAGNFFTAYEKRPTVKYAFEQYDLIPAAGKNDAEGDKQ